MTPIPAQAWIQDSPTQNTPKVSLSPGRAPPFKGPLGDLPLTSPWPPWTPFSLGLRPIEVPMLGGPPPRSGLVESPFFLRSPKQVLDRSPFFAPPQAVETMDKTVAASWPNVRQALEHGGFDLFRHPVQVSGLLAIACLLPRDLGWLVQALGQFRPVFLCQARALLHPWYCPASA